MAKKSVIEQIEHAKVHVCSKCCKWTEKYEKQYGDTDEAVEKQYNEKCVKCPLNYL